jgi:hypothetical protein
MKHKQLIMIPAHVWIPVNMLLPAPYGAGRNIAGVVTLPDPKV